LHNRFADRTVSTYTPPSAFAQPRQHPLLRKGVQDAKRPYGPLALLAALVLVPAFLAVIPAAEWGAVIVYLSVSSAGAFLLYHLVLKRIDPAFPTSLYVLAYLVKLLGCVARYWMVFDLYGGEADSGLYHQHGQILSQYFSVFDFSIMQSYVVRGEGTTMLAYLTGLLYTILPVSMAGAFFFFSVLAFTGTIFCYCAARVAWPEANLRYYTFCIFFLPSILFWPASLGKDAWILCWSGFAVWGWVTFIRSHKMRGLFWIVIALYFLQLVRPHIAALVAVSMAAAYLIYGTRSKRSIISWAIGAVVVIFVGYYMVTEGAAFLKLDDLSVSSLEARIQEQQERTTQGGSSYEVISIFMPLGLITGLVTSAVRPFPWEANSGQMLLTSLETLGWLFLCWKQRRTFWQKMRGIRSDPVAAFALFYTVTMLLALTSLGNFGIVARQRVMALPFLWMLFI
jgi:hypothetical protein